MELQGLDIIAANFPALRCLALLDCGVYAGLGTLVALPSLPSLQQLALTDLNWQDEDACLTTQIQLQQLRPDLTVLVARHPAQNPQGFVGFSPATAYNLNNALQHKHSMQEVGHRMCDKQEG